MAPIIATLCTNNSYEDLRLFLNSLSLCYSKADAPTIYLYTDSETMASVIADGYFLYIVFNTCLDAYSGLTRQDMEAVRRPHKTLWYEFQMEKLNLLDWVFESEPDCNEGVFYLDSDICFFGPLPPIPSTATVALSPHYIRKHDEARFGRYNGGFLWMRDQSAVAAWRAACPTSRFHEQAALECFDAANWKLYTFPQQVNYGWWRMFQGSVSPLELQSKWSFEPTGITVNGAPLQSVHTHFYKPSERACQMFNGFVISKMPEGHPLVKVIKFESALL